MKATEIKTTWHKVNGNEAMTYKQLQFIEKMRTEENVIDWPFTSAHNAMRSITKWDASIIISELKNGGTVKIV